jgi:hypothetical protein
MMLNTTQRKQIATFYPLVMIITTTPKRESMQYPQNSNSQQTTYLKAAKKLEALTTPSIRLEKENSWDTYRIN